MRVFGQVLLMSPFRRRLRHERPAQYLHTLSPPFLRLIPAELRWMCHLWEPMRCWYQPLGFYLFMEGAALLGALALRAGEELWMKW
jgi:hypothetical protein